MDTIRITDTPLSVPQPGSNLLRFLDGRRAVFFLIGFGLFLRLAALLLLSAFPLASDAVDYHETALRLLSGEHFAPYWPPGLPCYLLLFYKLFGASAFVARACMLPFYLAFSVLLYAYVKEIGSTRAANLAVLVFALYPTYIHLSVEPTTQFPVAACLVAIAFLVTTIVCRKASWGTVIALGLVLGWVTLIRPSSGFLLVAAPLYLWLRTKSLKNAVVSLVIATVVVGAWLVKAHELTGRFVMINYANSKNLFIGNNPYTPLYKTWWFGSHKAGEVEVPAAYTAMKEEITRNPPDVQDRLYKEKAISYIQSRPDLFLIRTVNRIRAYFAFDTFTGSFLTTWYHMSRKVGLSVIGLDALFYTFVMFVALVMLFGFRNGLRLPEHAQIAVGIVVLYAVPYFLSFAHPVYHFPVVPLFGALAAALAAPLLGTPRSVVSREIGWVLKRNHALLFALALFLYIQMEWVFVMRSRM
jgi:4-amino-4-deoxy-L-arabinose transferase-like glycosyltransferase